MTSSGALLALLDTLTFPETLTILVLALVVLGPEKLPGMARQAGRWMNKIKDVAAQLQSEVSDVMDDPAMEPLKQLGEFAVSPRAKLAELARTAITDAESEASGTTGTTDAAAIGADAGNADASNAAAPTLPPVVAVGPDHPMERLSTPSEPEPEAEPDGAPESDVPTA